MNVNPFSRPPQQLFQEHLRPCLYARNLRLAQEWRVADIEETIANILAPKLEDWLADLIHSMKADVAAP